jgi:hypothetical protein
MSIKLTVIIGANNQMTFSSLIKEIVALAFLSRYNKRSNRFVLEVLDSKESQCIV